MKLIPRLHPKRGFTLIELIMTIVVVGIVAIPLALSINQQIESVFASQDFAVARNLARLEMERTNNMVYANIISANFTNYEGYNYDLNRAVTYARGSGASRESLKKITVSVMKSGSAQVLVNLITYLAKNISYGL